MVRARFEPGSNHMSTVTTHLDDGPEDHEHVGAMDAQARTAVLDRYMAQKGLKSTRQRAIILEVFFEQGGHVSVDELLVLARRKDPPGLYGHHLPDHEAPGGVGPGPRPPFWRRPDPL